MKKWRFLWKYLLLVPLTGAVFALISQYYYRMATTHSDRELECLFYGLLLVLFAAVIGDLLKAVSVSWGKVICMMLPATVYMGLVVFANSYWHYLGFNSFLDWNDPIPWSVFLQENLRHIHNTPSLSVPLAVAATACAMAGLFLASLPRIRRSWAFERHRWSIRRLCKRDLEEVYLEATAEPEPPSLYDLAVYVAHMETTEENKNKLTDLAAKHQDEMLVYLILKHFGEQMEREEYLEYRTAFLEMATQRVSDNRRRANRITVTLPPLCQELDRHFHVTEEEE